MAAACTDDVEIGLSIWTRPEETPAEAAARQSLRKLVVHWWARNLEWEARAWLATVTCTHGDHEAADDYFVHSGSCQYFK